MREGVIVKTEEVKALTASVKELTRDYVNMAGSVRAATNSVDAAKKLWKTGNRSFLIKAGLTLIVFPEPVISDILGTALLAAGTIKEGIKRRSIYLDDLPKAFESVIKDLKSSTELVRPFQENPSAHSS
jgi:hypothetical protein